MKRTIKNEFLFLLSNIFIQMTLYIYDVLLIFLLYDKNMAALSGFFLATILPGLIVMFTGVVFDKFDKKKTLVLINVIKIIIMPLIIFSNNLILLYIITFVNSCLMEVSLNGNTIFAKQITNKDRLKMFLSKFNFISSGATIIGPVVSGIVIVYFENNSNNTSLIIISIIEICLIISTILLKFITIETQENIKINKKKIMKVNLKNFNKNVFKMSIMWCVFMFVVGMGLPLEIKYIQSILGLNVQYYALGNSIEGVGNLFIAVFLMIYIRKLNIFICIKSGLIMSALAYIIIGSAPNLIIYSVGAALVGMAAGIIPFSFKMFFQICVEDRILGRVYSSARFFVLLSRISGIFCVNVFIAFTNIRLMYYIMSIICVLLFLLIHFFERNSLEYSD